MRSTVAEVVIGNVRLIKGGDPLAAEQVNFLIPEKYRTLIQDLVAMLKGTPKS